MTHLTPSATHLPYTTLFRSINTQLKRTKGFEHIILHPKVHPNKLFLNYQSALQINLFAHRKHLTNNPEYHLIPDLDRKSTRLNSSHVKISYAVFCLNKKITN